ncbi:hypothetical protein FC17_GL002042 [Secundilactobacillus paracollinoides DSM 15502 = JCM 11969]|nr:hypothetical protein FC17_GL002042 [Secundilactobacillus paracollinoides DSM 15502 = JCM 11969]
MLHAGAGIFTMPPHKMAHFRSWLHQVDADGDPDQLMRWLFDNCLFGGEDKID